mgnify:CR=1 FL=1
MSDLPQVDIFTDGACKGNPGPGGWGAVLRFRGKDGDKERELSGGESPTTNNRMEMMAAIEALKQAEAIILVLDAQLGMEEQDIRIARLAEREGRALTRTTPAGEEIIARAAIDRIVALIAVEEVVAPVTINQVIAINAAQIIISVPPEDRVIARITPNNIRRAGAGDARLRRHLDRPRQRERGSRRG